MTKTCEQFSTRGIQLFDSKNKDDGGLPVISGYAVKFNAYSSPWYGIKVIVDQNFFNGILDDPDLCVLASYTHDTDGLNIVARYQPSAGVEKIKLSVDEIGLKYEMAPVNTQLGRDLVEQIRFGNVQGVSMGVEVAEDDWTGLKDGYQVRRLVQCGMLDHFAFTSCPAFASSSAGVSEFSISSPEMREFYKSKQKEKAPNLMPAEYFENKLRLIELDS